MSRRRSKRSNRKSPDGVNFLALGSEEELTSIEYDPENVWVVSQRETPPIKKRRARVE